MRTDDGRAPASRRPLVVFILLFLLVAAGWWWMSSDRRGRRPRPGESSTESRTRAPGTGEATGSRVEPEPAEVLSGLMRSRRGTLRGRLIDAGTGLPLEVEADLRLQAGTAETLRGRTGADGSFAVAGFPYPTPVRITVSREDEGIEHAESRFVAEDGESVELRVRRRTLLRGIIESADGRRLPGATVAVACFTRAGDPAHAEEDEVASDGEGRFRLLLDGAWAELKVAGKGGAGWQAALGTVTRTGEWVFEATIRAEPCWSVSGVVVDEAGRPVKDARVLLCAWNSIAAGERVADLGERRLLGVSGAQVRSRVDGSGWEVRNTYVRTDANGRFEGTPLLPAKRVFVAIHREGAPPRLIELDGGEERGPTERLDLGRMELRKPVRPLRMRLQRENGDPVAGCPVTFSLNKLPTGSGINTPVIHSDRDGWVSSDFLEEGGEYLMAVHDAGIMDMSKPMPVFAAQDEAVVVVPGPP